MILFLLVGHLKTQAYIVELSKRCKNVTEYIHFKMDNVSDLYSIMWCGRNRLAVDSALLHALTNSAVISQLYNVSRV